MCIFVCFSCVLLVFLSFLCLFRSNEVEDCFFGGTVNGDPSSFVSVSMCGGRNLRGFYLYQGRRYSVFPSPNGSTRLRSEGRHTVQDVGADASMASGCAVGANTPTKPSVEEAQRAAKARSLLPNITSGANLFCCSYLYVVFVL